jgi:hypothetical protein
MEWTRLRPTADGRRSELTQSAITGRCRLAALRQRNWILSSNRGDIEDPIAGGLIQARPTPDGQRAPRWLRRFRMRL